MAQGESPTSEEVWRALLSGEFDWKQDRRRFQRLPGSERCKNCLAPLKGPVALFMRWIGRGRYQRNPKFCNF